MTKETAILWVDPEGVGPQSHLISIFDPTDVGKALFDTGWTNTEAIELLASIARDTVNNTARERMAAVKMIEDKSEKALTLAGIIKRVSLEASTQDGDVTKKLTAEGLQLIRDGSARTMSTLELLEAGRQVPELIDIDPVEETSDPRTRGTIPSSEYSRTNGKHIGPGHAGGDASRVSRSEHSERGIGTGHVVHEQERTTPTHSEVSGTQNNPTTTGGAENERSTRTTIQPGRSVTSSRIGKDSLQPELQHGQDHGPSGESTTVPIRTRTTPYTPGEARRSATILSQKLKSDSGGEPPVPSLDTVRPGDGDSDTRRRTPHIAARFLPAALAATGFPGDDSPH